VEPSPQARLSWLCVRPEARDRSAPDNLVVVPFGRKLETEPRPGGEAEAAACPSCGDFSLQQRGAGWTCDTCGAAPALQGGDQG
jgi:ribonucleoside-diphosphate reductase alpha chain